MNISAGEYFPRIPKRFDIRLVAEFKSALKSTHHSSVGDPYLPGWKSCIGGETTRRGYGIVD